MYQRKYFTLKNLPGAKAFDKSDKHEHPLPQARNLQLSKTVPQMSDHLLAVQIQSIQLKSNILFELFLF